MKTSVKGVTGMNAWFISNNVSSLPCLEHKVQMGGGVGKVEKEEKSHTKKCIEAGCREGGLTNPGRWVKCFRQCRLTINVLL